MIFFHRFFVYGHQYDVVRCFHCTINRQILISHFLHNKNFDDSVSFSIMNKVVLVFSMPTVYLVCGISHFKDWIGLNWVPERKCTIGFLRHPMSHCLTHWYFEFVTWHIVWLKLCLVGCYTSSNNSNNTYEQEDIFQSECGYTRNWRLTTRHSMVYSSAIGVEILYFFIPKLQLSNLVPQKVVSRWFSLWTVIFNRLFIFLYNRSIENIRE